MVHASASSGRRTRLAREIEKLRSEMIELDQMELELRASLSDARKQLAYYRNLVSSMKKAVSPSKLKRVIRLL